MLFVLFNYYEGILCGFIYGHACEAINPLREFNSTHALLAKEIAILCIAIPSALEYSPYTSSL
tara:strand:+ start:589 stop:777 length:189 start_codon:yes stop_codon:yes gene_type:complete